MKLNQVILRPLVTEKAMAAQALTNSYVFAVDPKADKGLVKAAVEQMFNVKVNHVNTAIVRGKVKRVGRNIGKRPNIKRATVQLAEGQKIEIFEGV